MRERRSLLTQPGVLWQEPRIEFVPPYEATIPLGQCCQELGISAELAEFSACGLFPAGRRECLMFWCARVAARFILAATAEPTGT